MRRVTTYEELQRLYPEAVEQAVAKLRKSRSKHRKADPATLKWEYNWCVQCRAVPKSFTSQQIADDQVARTYMTLSVANYYHSEQIEPPQWLWDEVEEVYRQDQAEQARLAALTPEERRARLVLREKMLVSSQRLGLALES